MQFIFGFLVGTFVTTMVLLFSMGSSQMDEYKEGE